jgi:hypothetical protein
MLICKSLFATLHDGQIYIHSYVPRRAVDIESMFQTTNGERGCIPEMAIVHVQACIRGQQGSDDTRHVVRSSANVRVVHNWNVMRGIKYLFEYYYCPIRLACRHPPPRQA